MSDEDDHHEDDSTTATPTPVVPTVKASATLSAAGASRSITAVGSKRLPRKTSSAISSSTGSKGSFYKSAAGLGNASQREIIAGTRKIAKELHEFEKHGLQQGLLEANIVVINPLPIYNFPHVENYDSFYQHERKVCYS
mmetsp:Transcript_26482/g.37184  ORF Transcript_26482/g.37184 Transcript_26482/m.37184 type:complete len:139 (-) Transcript_26482:254-670(-)